MTTVYIKAGVDLEFRIITMEAPDLDTVKENSQTIELEEGEINENDEKTLNSEDKKIADKLPAMNKYVIPSCRPGLSTSTYTRVDGPKTNLSLYFGLTSQNRLFIYKYRTLYEFQSDMGLRFNHNYRIVYKTSMFYLTSALQTAIISTLIIRGVIKINPQRRDLYRSYSVKERRHKRDLRHPYWINNGVWDLRPRFQNPTDLKDAIVKCINDIAGELLCD